MEQYNVSEDFDDSVIFDVEGPDGETVRSYLVLEILSRITTRPSAQLSSFTLSSLDLWIHLGRIIIQRSQAS